MTKTNKEFLKAGFLVDQYERRELTTRLVNSAPLEGDVPEGGFQKDSDGREIVVLEEQGASSKIWNAAVFPGATDTAKIKEAIKECKVQGGAYVWLGGKGFWSITETIVVPAGVRVSGAMLGLATRLTATGNFYIFALGEAGDASEIILEFMFLRAESPQASGGAVTWAANGTIFHIHDIRFGSNLKTSINCAGFLISAGWFENLVWNDGATQVKKCGIAINLGDGTNLVNQIRFRAVECTAATTADMVTGLEMNFVDTVSVADSIFEVMETGIQMGFVGGGSTSTGVKFTNVVVDTTKGSGWNLGKYRDVELVNCNAQTCGTKLVGVGVNLRAGKGFRMNGGTIQHNENHGFVAENLVEDFMLDGVNITDNNMSNEGGSGISIAAGISGWKVTRCESGNFYALSGKQQFGVIIEAGGSKDFQVVDNTWNGNTVGGIENKGTGANQTLCRNSTVGGSRAWGVLTKRKTAEAITPNKAADTLVKLSATTKPETETILEVLVGGVLIATPGTAKGAAAVKSAVTDSFVVPATLTYEVKIKTGTLEPAEYETAYLTL